MFAASPSPAKKVLSPVKKVAKFKEAGSQVSPAFVAAGKEARRKDRLAAIGSKKEGLAIPTPATVGVKNKKKSDKEKNGVELEEDVMDNPTPAMKAILQKRQADLEDDGVVKLTNAML